MKTKARNWGILAAALIAFAVAGCATKQVYVSKAPPAPQQENRPIPENANDVWAEGHWAWEGHWVWLPGHWMHPPNFRSTWESGQWQQTAKGWAWREGRWHETGLP